MIGRRNLLALGLTALSGPMLTRPAFAQSKFPDRPIRLVIPFPPGGGYDAVGRPWAEKMKPVLGTVIVENQGGGGGSLGAAAVARARPDGYTILVGGSTTHITEAILKSRPLYDPIEELEPISNVVVAAYALAIHPAVPARTLKEFIDHAKANPGKLSYGHAGVGTLNHLTGELLKSLTSTDIVHVPYRGSGPATVDALSGQVAMVIPAVTGQTAGIPSDRQAADSRRDQSQASNRCAGDSDGGRSGISRHDLTAVDWPVCSDRDTQGDH